MSRNYNALRSKGLPLLALVASFIGGAVVESATRTTRIEPTYEIGMVCAKGTKPDIIQDYLRMTELGELLVSCEDSKGNQHAPLDVGPAGTQDIHNYPEGSFISHISMTYVPEAGQSAQLKDVWVGDMPWDGVDLYGASKLTSAEFTP